MSKSRRRAHVSSYILLMQHLSKWQFQRERRSRSWVGTIDHERIGIAGREAESSEFRVASAMHLADAYRRARRSAAHETELPLSTFPETCPYTAEQLRDRDFLPE
ncbi:DUF29 family protein [Jiella avicenniae]|uniref:DUF29 family protein n=1 Tax=Jiella avicenniae TaxID=2907202 RepID=UPI003B849C2F